MSHSTVIERYAGFLRKIEKGKYKWGSENAVKDLEQVLIYRVFTVGAKGGQSGFKGNQEGGITKKDPKAMVIGNSIVQILIVTAAPLWSRMKENLIE